MVLFPFLVLAADHGYPEGTWWDEAKDPAIWATFAIAGLAVAQGVLGLLRAPDAVRAKFREDLERLARRAFVPINANLPTVPINQLGVHVWEVRGDRLVSVVKFTMEHQRATTPIRWERGKGAIGIAWQRVAPVTAELSYLYKEAVRADAATFDALEADYRYGLTRAEVLTGTRYKGILAYPLTDLEDRVIGVLSVDCGIAGQEPGLSRLLDDRAFQDVLGSCQIALREYVGR